MDGEHAIAVEPANARPAAPARKHRSDQLDLIEARRNLLIVRSRHCDDATLVKRINRLISRIAYLHEPANAQQARNIRRAVDDILRDRWRDAPTRWKIEPNAP